MTANSSLLFVNNLDYSLPAPSSVATGRQHKRSYFQNRSYSQGETMVAQLNTGTDFIDTSNSSIVIKVKTTGTGVYGAGFGSGSVMNLMKNIRIMHRSGTSYTNTQKLNMFTKLNDRFTKSAGWFSTIGANMGYGRGASLFDDVDDEQTFVIPLHQLHGFFQSEGGQFIPPQVASGLRVEIDLASLGECFLESVAGLTAYSVTQVYFDNMSVSLMDSAMASLNSVAQTSSLEYVFTDIYTAQNAVGVNTNINLDVNKSVGMASRVLSMVQQTNTINDVTTDSFVIPYLAGKWGYVLGSVHFPNVDVDSLETAYHQSLVSYDKMKHVDKECSVTRGDFIDSDGIYTVSLERDTSLALSQSPVNASRALRFQLILDSAPASASIATVFMQYLVSTRTTLTSSQVDQ